MRDLRDVLRSALAAVLLVVTTGAVTAQGDAEHRLQPLETVTVNVGKWDSVEEQYTGWPDLGGEYRIGSGGRLALPMTGEIEAAGMTTTELSNEIAGRLASRMGLSGQVEASVSILEFRPVYVVGGVQQPGAYPYTPGLSALQAIGLAGGMRSSGTTFLRSERSALSTMGEYRVLELSLLRQLATVARLQAELNDAEQIDTPEEVANAPMGDELMRREREIMEAREASLESSLSQLDEIENLLEERITRLEEQLKLRARQLELAQEELESASQLVERGLSVESRRNSLERLVADQEVRRLELETAKLNAEQSLSEVGRDRADLINERRRGLVESIRNTRSDVEETRVKMQTQASLYAESLQYGDGFVQMDGTAAPVLTVTRETAEGSEQIDVDRTSTLHPGDVLEVTLPGPSGVSMPAATLPSDVTAPDSGSSSLPANPGRIGPLESGLSMRGPDSAATQ
ncbi:polysaccharide biosynthesis/export family protein [Tranquillimonas rosea]|uniref:polysaccharide biosynthesis/export family protein n=1 Tax=Tranquillimonas rosea TaxID=641238 RepID=UPI003BAA9EBA